VFFQDPRSLFKLTERLSAETGPLQADAIYTFGQTTDNQASSLDAAAELCLAGKAELVATCDGETDHGDAGHGWRRRHLLQHLPDECIYGIWVPRDVRINTRSDAQAAVREAKKLGWKMMWTSSPPFHQFRAWLTIVQVILAEYPELNLWNLRGKPLKWHSIVRHCQGTLVAPRVELLDTEYDRCIRYFGLGHIASCERALEYMDERDRRTSR
jgi:hypothetical protein